ncbi:MAG TPA: M3 family metallopeptidase [Gemmatimonadales bacterium]|nr:M3 family metallopeptidase [Gemmatimonadales bacterium]
MPAATLLLTALLLAPPAARRPSDDRPFWSDRPTASAFTRRIDQRLTEARAIRGRLLTVRGRRTIANTLTLYDQLRRDLEGADNQTSLIAAVHPDSAVRAAAEAAAQRVAALATEVSLDRRIYDALGAMDTVAADAATRYYVQRTLLGFRLAGVDKDEATRARIRTLNEELIAVGQEFNRNIREGGRTVAVDSAGELAGLPEDFIAAHPPGADGRIVLTTEYPDAIPVFTYARSDDLRRRMRVAFDTRAYPKNMAVLDRLIATRAELARLLGFGSWADLATADKMIGSAANASAFIDRIAEASRPAAEAEYRRLLDRKRQDDPSATAVNRWESGYLRELVRRSAYDFDSQKARPYFPYEAVKRGVLDLSSRLFGVTFRRVTVPVWDPSVEAYEMFEGGRRVGRFYLDMHPRPGKYSHAAHFAIRSGVGRQDLPEGALVCNLPGGTPGDPGLMSHDDVRTVFHEFGHLLHAQLGGRGRWLGQSGVKTEWDFVEAPSQMLEEWIRDPAVLATFARHYETGEPIPAELVRQMNAAEAFGRALDVRAQMALARISLSVYDRPPAQVNTDSIVQAVSAAYLPYPPMSETHFQASFGHLVGYSAVYYTYMWSLVIAKDLFSGFDRANLLAAAPARRYREAILAPGGTAPAAVLVERFLGRPFSFDAWRRWLDSGD